MLELTPRLLGPSVNTNQGIIGESVDLTLAHLADMRSSTILFRLAQHLLYKKYRDPGDEPKLHLFGQLKRVTRQWIDGGYLKCTGGTYPAQVLYHGIADMAAERIKAAITETLQGERPVKAILDAYNPTGSTAFVNFTTSKELRWQTAPNRSHVKWVVCDSEWEAEFARVAESHPRVLSYVKNQGLGLEVPYLMGSTPRKYLPDFIVQIDDGCITVEGQPDPLNLIVEVKGYRGEDAKDKANTMMVATRSDPAVQALDADASNDSRAAVFAAAFARRAIIDWEGVGDESSTAIAVSPERIDALLSLWPIFEAFNLQNVSRGMLLDAEKTPLRPRRLALKRGRQLLRGLQNAVPRLPRQAEPADQP